MTTNDVRGTDLGRIPLRIRVGVTGHRTIDHPELVAKAVDGVIAKIKARISPDATTPVVLTAVSPIAEGADRIIARRILRDPGARLEIALPLHRDDYRKDFIEPSSKHEFDRLVEQHRIVSEPPPADQPVVGEDRDAAYARAGAYVLDHCDVLLAIWDGEKARGHGGTGWVVELAMSRDLPVFWVDPRPNFESHEANAARILDALAEEAHAYNRHSIRADDFAASVERERSRLLPANRSVTEKLHVEAYADWILPYFVRADQLAVNYRGRYDRGTLVILASAAIAVLSASLHAVWWHDAKVLLAVEAALVVVVAVQYAWGRQRRIHPRWISYRFLAERARSAHYLALAGLHDRGGGVETPQRPDARQEWVRRAFAEIWDAQPEPPGDRDAHLLGEFLAGSWLGESRAHDGTGQIAYHEGQAERLHRSERRLSAALLVVFLTVLVVALAHPFVHDEEVAKIMTVASLFLPAVGAGLAALSADREYSRHAERYEQMAAELGRIRPDLRSVDRQKDLWEATVKAEQTMLEENRNWFLVRRFHDFELGF